MASVLIYKLKSCYLCNASSQLKVSLTISSGFFFVFCIFAVHFTLDLISNFFIIAMSVRKQ